MKKSRRCWTNGMSKTQTAKSDRPRHSTTPSGPRTWLTSNRTKIFALQGQRLASLHSVKNTTSTCALARSKGGANNQRKALSGTTLKRLSEATLSGLSSRTRCLAWRRDSSATSPKPQKDYCVGTKRSSEQNTRLSLCCIVL